MGDCEIFSNPSEGLAMAPNISSSTGSPTLVLDEDTSPITPPILSRDHFAPVDKLVGR